MRRKDRQTSIERAYETVDKCVYVSMAVINPDGTPYCMPLTIVRDRSKIYFHCAKEGQKLDAIKANPNVCLSCVSYAENDTVNLAVNYESAIVTGKAYIVDDEVEKDRALRLLCAHHAPGNIDGVEEEMARAAHRAAVVRIEIDEVTGKRC